MSAYAAPSAAELHLLFTLSDSALPTGGFIASSGLESYAKHGFLVSSSSPASFSSYPNPASSPSQALTEFARAEVEHYANTTAVFVISAFKCVESALSISTEEKGREKPIDELVHVDAFHEATLLSHVSRRSSKAQGVALLTLFSRGLAVPTGFGPSTSDPKHETELDPAGERGGRDIVMGYKRLIRAGRAMGHLAVCWGVMTAVLGLSLDRSLHLYLFLHARSLLSSAVRLNTIGPYASSQLLLHPFREIIGHAVSHSQAMSLISFPPEPGHPDEDVWAWADEKSGPATTYPLGEVLMARHDLQHSRIFNS